VTAGVLQLIVVQGWVTLATWVKLAKACITARHHVTMMGRPAVLMVRFHFVQVVVSTMLHPTVLASQTGGVGKAAEVAVGATIREHVLP